MNKKLLALFLACFLPVALLAGSGDVNGDGKIDIADIVEIVNFWQGKQSERFIFDKADVNNDGEVDKTDVEAISSRIMVGASPIDISTRKISIIDSYEWQTIEIAFTSNTRDALEDIEWQISEDCKEWLSISWSNTDNVGGEYVAIFKFSIAPNRSANCREGEIVFINSEYDFRESVVVKTEPFFVTNKEEYHVVNQGFRYLDIHVETSIDAGGYTYQILECEGDWLRNEDGSIEYDNNWTGKDREAKMVIGAVNYPEISKTVKIVQHAATIGNGSTYHTVTCQPSGGVLEIPIIGNTSLDARVTINIERKEELSFLHRLDDVIRDGSRIIRFNVDANESIEERFIYEAFTIQVGDGIPEIFRFRQLGKDAPSFEEQRSALKLLYESTNGKDWLNSSNWLTDMPINKWYGVNNDQWGGDTIIGDYILSVNLENNHIIGKVPSALESLIQIPDFNIDGNGLYGRIPDVVINHTMWQEKGWNVVVQNLWHSGRRLLEYDNLKLQLPPYEIDHMNGEMKTSDALFAKNKINVLMTDIPSEGMSNLHLSYHNKGYGTIVSFIDVNNREELENKANKFSIKDIEYVWGFPWDYSRLSGLWTSGTWYVFDDKADLLACYVRDWDIPDEWYVSKVDSICRKFLGEPEEHAPYIAYTSTDYSMDGKAKLLQQATMGKGIDIVFIGECFTDNDMEDGGEYDLQMQTAIEQFFSEEPYKSLRNRFNVWQVKAVSAKEDYLDKANQAIGEDDAKAFDYAKCALGDDAELMFVNVIYKMQDNDFFIGSTSNTNRSYTSMYSGSYVAYDKKAGRTINHEGGGHGIALLADEYVEPGNEDVVFGEGDCNHIDYEWETYGANANVDWRSNPSLVKWSRFINDERYADEHIGVFEGAHLVGKGCYRPTENSMMRHDDCGFNAPSREAIYKRVMRLSEGDDWTYDYETFVAFDAPAREAYKAAQARSRTRGVEVQPMRRIESRPPTIYKGTWRDAGKCEKIEMFK